MILLSRYLLAQFAINFITVSTAFVAVYLLVDFFEKIDTFTTKGGTMGMALKFFFLNIPFILDQLSPVLILLSGVITLGILNHNNELRALKAGGIPLRTIINPILIGAFLATILFLAMAQWLLPRTIATTNKIWYEQLQGKVPLGIFRNGRYYYKGKEGFYSFRWPDTEELSFQNLSYSRWSDDSYKLSYMLTAEQADWKNDQWLFRNGQTQSITLEDSYAIDIFDRKNMLLPESPDAFFIPEYKAAEMSVTDLFRDANSKETVEETIISWTNFYSRISYLFLGIPLLFLGLPTLMLSYQRWGRDLAIAIPASCMLAFVAWGFWGALQSFSKAGYILPSIAAVAIHLIFASTGILLLRQQDK